MARAEVDTIKRWYEHGEGREIVESLLPEQASKIEQYYRIPQERNETTLAGTYYFDFICGTTKYTAYVGESGNIYWRLLEHLYNLVNGVTEWGIPAKDILSRNILVEWIGVTGVTDKISRENKEAELIEVLKPFLQYTDRGSLEYGRDKWWNGLTRDKIRPDMCVCQRLRRERGRKLFSINK